MTVVINGTTGITSVNGSAAAPSVTGTDTDTGIVYGTNTLSLATGGTTAVTVDSSQNVGIGAVPVAGAGKLQLSATEIIGFQASGGGNIASNLYYSSGWKYITTGTATLYSQASGAHYWACVASGSANATASFSNAMTLDASGNLLVGVASGSTNRFQNDRSGDQTLYVTNTNASNPFGLYVSYAVAPNSTGSWFISCQDSVGNKMRVHSNGGIANYQANNVNLSDRREKTNFAPAGDYLAKICAIPVQTFNYIDQNMEEDGALTLGVIAQDVEAVAPELVMETDWGTKEEPKIRLSIYQTDLQYALMKCIQEQQAIIEQLRADVEALKAA